MAAPTVGGTDVAGTDVGCGFAVSRGFGVSAGRGVSAADAVGGTVVDVGAAVATEAVAMTGAEVAVLRRSGVTVACPGCPGSGVFSSTGSVGIVLASVPCATLVARLSIRRVEVTCAVLGVAPGSVLPVIAETATRPAANRITIAAMIPIKAMGTLVPGVTAVP